MRPEKSKNGFTLIELLVVIAIIAILAAILFPVFINAQVSARTAKCGAHARELVSALQMYIADWSQRLPNGTFVGYYDMKPRYWPYMTKHEMTRCSESVRIQDWETGKWETQWFAYAYNHALCGPNKIYNHVPGNIKDRCDVWKNDNTPEGWSGRPYSDIKRPSRTPAIFCSRPLFRAPGDWGTTGYQWEPEDIANPDRMRNPHNGGTNYGFLDGHAKWFLPAGGGFYMATDGIDYDGNGSVGGVQFMR